MSRFRSPLAIARNHGASGTGSGAFLWERLTTLLSIPLGLVLLFQLFNRVDQGMSLTLARDWLGSPLNGALLAAFYLIAMVNGYLCSRKMLEDYLHTTGIKLVALLGLTVGTWMMGLVVLVSIFYITFRLQAGIS